MKVLICALLGFLFTWFVWWIGGGEFIRSPELASTFVMSVITAWVGAITGAITQK